MRVLLIHDYYQQRGGECAVFESEQRVLRAAGHEVGVYTRHNAEIAAAGAIGRSAVALRTLWNPESRRALGRLLAELRPEVAHFTNTFPLISPSAYYACRDAGVPIVQSLHNYRWLCPAATFFRDGAVCEECVDFSLLRGVRHACYRGSHAGSAVVATLIALHRDRSLFGLVDRFVALTQFARDKFVAAGLAAERIAVKPNSAEIEPGAPRPVAERRYALFAGRLSEEKGVHTLLDAWRRLSGPIPLRIAGDGPLRGDIERRIGSERIGAVEMLGALGHDALVETLRGARVLVFPSLWYEGMPMAIVEAFGCGVPPIASRLGGMAEMIDAGENGLLFRAGDAADLAARVEWAFANDGEVESLGRAARRTFDAHHDPARDGERLGEIYREAIDANRRR